MEDTSSKHKFKSEPNLVYGIAHEDVLLSGGRLLDALSAQLKKGLSALISNYKEVGVWEDEDNLQVCFFSLARLYMTIEYVYDNSKMQPLHWFWNHTCYTRWMSTGKTKWKGKAQTEIVPRGKLVLDNNFW